MTRRLLLSYLTVTVLVLAMLEIPLGILYAQRERDRFATDVQRDANRLATFYEDALEQDFAPQPGPAHDYAVDSAATVLVVDRDDPATPLLWFGPDGEPPVGAPTGVGDDPALVAALTGSTVSTTDRTMLADVEAGADRVVAVPSSSTGRIHGAVRIAVDDHEISERILQYWLGLATIAGAVLTAMAGIGWTVARSVSRPLRRLEGEARRFARGDLRPITVHDRSAPDEVTHLAATLDLMARRLDRLLEDQRAFVADASHQLRTPLTALRLRLEFLEAELPSPPAPAEVEAAIAEVDRLAGLVGALLDLARADRQEAQVPIDAAAVCRERADTWRGVAEPAGVAIDTGSIRDVVVLAAPGTIEQIVDNLLDNAIAASSPGQTVGVETRPGPTTATIAIVDHGRGLDDAEKARATDRFWRGDTARPGTGLGLAIVARLVAASAGSVDLADTPGGGLTATVTVPLA